MALSNGQYMGKVAADGPACIIGKSEKKGTPQVTVVVEVAEGHRIGEQMKWIGYLSGGALSGTISALRKMGFTGDVLEEFPNQIPAETFPFEVSTEPYNGKDYTKITRIGGAIVLSAAEIKALSDELKPKLAQFVATPSDPLGGDEPPF